MKKIHKDAKILSISHNDLDGVGCQILLGGVFRNITYMNLSYGQVDKELMLLDEEEYDCIFITDISPKVQEVMDRFDNLIMIDHHDNAENRPEKKQFVNKKYSATYLTNHFLKKMYGKKRMAKFSKLVKLINDYDMWHLKYKGSVYLNYLFGHYHDEKFRKRFRTGDLSLTPQEKFYLKGIQAKFDETYDNLRLDEFENINACFFISDVYVNELSHRLMMEEGYDFVFFNTLKHCKISIRSKIDFNFGRYLKDKGIGGGHAKSCGIDIQTEEEMKNMMEFLEKDLYDILPSVRK